MKSNKKVYFSWYFSIYFNSYVGVSGCPKITITIRHPVSNTQCCLMWFRTSSLILHCLFTSPIRVTVLLRRAIYFEKCSSVIAMAWRIWKANRRYYLFIYLWKLLYDQPGDRKKKRWLKKKNWAHAGWVQDQRWW